MRRATRRARSRLLSVLFALLFLGGQGCESKTGLVIDVKKGDGFQQAPDTLRFLVGVEAEGLHLTTPIACGAGDETLLRFVRTPESPSDIADVSDRDLHTDPYRLLLEPHDDLPVGGPVLVVVGAFTDGQLIGVGALETPATFVQGKVLRWEVTLQPWNATEPAGGFDRCICASGFLGYDAVIMPPDDPDCDGDTGVDDCDDSDPAIGMSSPEICGDGIDNNCNQLTDELVEEVCDGVDNNCNGLCDEGFDEDGDLFTTCGSRTDRCDGTFSDEFVDCDPANPNVYPNAPELCDGVDNNCIVGDARFPQFTYCYDFNDADGICWLGERECQDELDGWVTGCLAPEPVDEAYKATLELCESFYSHAESPDQFDQANAIFTEEVPCVLHTIAPETGAGRVCPTASQVLPHPGVADDTACSWTILGNGLDAPFDATFVVEGLEKGSVLGGCTGSLAIQALDATAQEGELLLIHRVYDQIVHARALIRVELVNSELECPTQGPALVCDFSAWPVQVPAP